MSGRSADALSRRGPLRGGCRAPECRERRNGGIASCLSLPYTGPSAASSSRFTARIDRKAIAKRNSLGLDRFGGSARLFFTRFQPVENGADHSADLRKLFHAESARRPCRRAYADAGRDRRLLRVDRNAIFVDRDVSGAQRALRRFPGQPFRTKV